MLSKLLIAWGSLSLVGCAAITTRVEYPGAADVQDGLMYWMPQRDVLVKVAFVDGKPTVTFDRSDAYADSTRAYVARFRRNPIGKNELTVKVNARGLLESTQSKTTSDVTEIFKAIAGSAGTARTAMTAPSTKPGCPENGALTVRVEAGVWNGSGNFPGNTDCPVNVKIKEVTGAKSYRTSTRIEDPKSKDHPGFFYRQEFPYEVSVQFGSWQSTGLIMLPNDGPVRFLPVERSFFANNQSDLIFSEGSPTQYQQSVDGEAISLFKLPAAVFEAYFDAVGAMFTNRKEAATGEKDYLAVTLQLMAQQRAVDACRAALDSKDQQRIADDCK